MTPSAILPSTERSTDREPGRLDYLDATRAFALVLGVVFHASLSFMPVFMGWAVQDVSTSPLVGAFAAASHAFRMELFFLLAGFFAHLSFHRRGAGEFLRSRLLRIAVPFAVGWFLLRPLLVSGWIMGAASLQGDVDILAGLAGGFQSLSSLPSGLFTGSHLWFLYYLAMITTLFVGGRAILEIAGSWKDRLAQRTDALVAWLARSPVSFLILAIPTAGALWFMRFWSMDTPDQSLRPHVPVLLIYGAFFGLGWLLDRQHEAIARFSRLALSRWILAGVGLVGILLLGEIERDPGHPHYVAAHIAYALSYGLTMWTLVFLSIGVFRRLCRRPNAFVRYVADASYWMYLIHLPVVVWLQVAVAELPLYWWIKLGFVSAVTVSVSLVTYDLFVRSTFIGACLNGRRRERVMWPMAIQTACRLRRALPIQDL